MARPTSQQVHIHSALTRIAVAFKNPNYIAETVFPRLPVNHISDKFWVWDPSSYFRDEAQVRPPGTAAARIDASLTTGSYMCVEYAAAAWLDDDVRDNADDPLGVETTLAERATDKLLLAMERRVAAIVTASANWASSASAGTVWSDDTSDPFGDSACARSAILLKSGMYPNTMVVSACAHEHLIQHPDILDRIKYVREAVPGLVLNEDLMARVFQVERYLVGTAVYETAIEGATSAMRQIWTDNAVFNAWWGYVPRTPGLMVPAAGYTVEFDARRLYRFRHDPVFSTEFVAKHTVDELVSASEAGFVAMTCV